MNDTVLNASRDSIRRGSTSFAAAARLFDPRIREDAYMLYAWCRHCDDEIDGQVMGHGAVGLYPVQAERKLAERRSVVFAALGRQLASATTAKAA